MKEKKPAAAWMNRTASGRSTHPWRGGGDVVHALRPGVHLRRRHVVDALVPAAGKHLAGRNVVHLKRERSVYSMEA